MRKTSINPQEKNLHLELLRLKDSITLGDTVHLTLEGEITPAEINELLEWVTSLPATSIAQLSLPISRALLASPEFLLLLEALKKKAPRALALVFSEDELNLSKSEIEQQLMQVVATQADFPTLVVNAATHARVSLKAFEEQMIKAIQGASKILPVVGVEDELEWSDTPKDEGDKKRIRLKSLIHKNVASDTQFNHFIQVDVEHTEILDTEEVLENTIAVSTEQKTEQYFGDVIDYALFNSPRYQMIAAKSAFRPEQIATAFRLAEREWFANLPHAVKFLSPAAAEKLAANLPQWVAMNKENMAGFILKKTEIGEFVLDYELAEQELEPTPFTPHLYTLSDERLPYYTIDFQASTLQLINNLGIAARIRNMQGVPLMNLWIRYGDQGVKAFFDKLNNLDSKHPGWSVFLDEAYLSHFDHLEDLYNEDFFDSLNKLESYSPLQMSCLKRFLQHTGSSRHNLLKTLEAFDCFWAEISKRCGNNDAMLAQLDTNWVTPAGGQPCVYMERLLLILKNARVLGDQLHCLDGLTLDQYGAYYASKYEGFTGVDPRMNFHYQPEKLNRMAFSSDYQLYRVDFTQLCEIAKTSFTICRKAAGIGKHNPASRSWVVDSKEGHGEDFDQFIAQHHAMPFIEYTMNYDELPPSYSLYYNGKVMGVGKYFKQSDHLPTSLKTFYPLLYRFMGQQLSGMTVHSFIQASDAYRESNAMFNSPDSSREELEFGVPLQVFQTLFYITHERYIGQMHYWDKSLVHYERKSLQPTFPLLAREASHIVPKNALAQITNMKRLYDQNIKLSDVEAFYFLRLQNFGINPGYPLAPGDGFRWSKLSEEYPDRIFAKLVANKYAVFKFINFIDRLPPLTHSPFGIADVATTYALNTHDYFSEIPIIANTLSDDLLLFSGMLNHYQLNRTKEKFVQYMQSAEHQDVAKLKKIRTYLQQAASGDLNKNTLYYAFKLMTDSEQFLTYDTVLAVFSEVSQLSLKEGRINTEAVQYILTTHHIAVNIKVPDILQYDSDEVKSCIMAIIRQLEVHNLNRLTPAQIHTYIDTHCSLFDAAHLAELNAAHSQDKEAQIACYVEIHQRQLNQNSLAELQVVLKDTIAESGTLIKMLSATFLKKTMQSLRLSLISSLFKPQEEHAAGLKFMQAFAGYTMTLRDLSDEGDFEKIDRAVNEAKPIAIACKAVARHACMQENEQAFLDLFAAVEFKRLDSELVYRLMLLLGEMPQRNYLPIVAAMLAKPGAIYDKACFIQLMNFVSKLARNQWSTPLIVDFCHRFAAFPDPHRQFDTVVDKLLPIYADDPADPMLRFLLTDPKLTLTEMTTLAVDTRPLGTNRAKLTDLYRTIANKNQLAAFLQHTAPMPTQQKTMILSIMTRAFARQRAHDPDINPVELVASLSALTLLQLTSLSTLYDSTPSSMACLHHALKDVKPDTSMDAVLETIEKAPFGARNFKEQFSCKEVERVINESGDLNNKTPYPYQYRKQLMEAFLLINEMGYRLPVFNGKTACELSNTEIQNLFAELKANEDMDPTQRKCCALTLMREVMYRSTGQFPYSTQMIVLLDCMMHEGDVISKVDTGQGKSLIDIMKAALLWMVSDRVDVTTSSLVDAKRDIEHYSPFLTLLGVPFAAKPITASTNFHDFCNNGVNFSTSSQLLLFHLRAMASDYSLDTPNNRQSFIPNESDFSVLDDLTVKRFATQEGVKIGKKSAWIYEAINDYVKTPQFTQNTTSIQTDVYRLRRYLMSRGRAAGKSLKFLDHDNINDDVLLAWIESAILANYKLRENYDYMILPVPDAEERFVAKVLMKDTRPSPDSVFGKGIHQLLHAELNQEKRIKTKSGQDAFDIEPENQTILSASNRNLLDYYRSKNGFIWGSSGTPGSDSEIEEQSAKYGFRFSQIEPHQKKQVVEKKLVVLDNEAAQHKRLTKEVLAKRKAKSVVPTLIFCEDIEKAKKLYAHLLATTGKDKLQLFTGSGDEEAIIQKAAEPGMFTITTSAIGRNTDIPYNKKTGLDIWHTCISSTRLDRQKSGRTGRQGSKGVISYFLNQQDQGIKTKKDIERVRQQFDEVAKQEREFNEEFYIVIGHYLTCLRQIPSAFFTEKSKQQFFRENWASFSAAQELAYRELKLKHEYQRKTFVAHVEATFVKMIKESAPDYDVSQMPAFTETIHPTIAAYNPYLQKVKMSDCIPPVSIAYEWFHTGHQGTEATLTNEDKKRIIQALKQLFSKTDQKNVMAKHAQFFRFLHTTPANQAALREIYQEFLKGFLEEKPKFFALKRWFGFANHLNKIANNEHYLCLFHALTSVARDKNQPALDADMIKKAIHTLLEEYLQNSWFISPWKREATIALQRTIHRAKALDEVVSALVKGQLDIAGKDIQLNKRKWRLSVNFFGNSRLQSTISNALSLAASLGVETQTDNLVVGLVSHLKSIASKGTEPIQDKATVDDAKNIRRSPKTKDNSNARVLATSLEKAIKMDQPSHKLPGMIGRHAHKPKM